MVIFVWMSFACGWAAAPTTTGPREETEAPREGTEEHATSSVDEPVELPVISMRVDESSEFGKPWSWDGETTEMMFAQAWAGLSASASSTLEPQGSDRYGVENPVGVPDGARSST